MATQQEILDADHEALEDSWLELGGFRYPCFVGARTRSAAVMEGGSLPETEQQIVVRRSAFGEDSQPKANDFARLVWPTANIDQNVRIDSVEISGDGVGLVLTVVQDNRKK